MTKRAFAVRLLALLVAAGGADAAWSEGDLTLQEQNGAPFAGLTALQLERFETGRIDYQSPISIEMGSGPGLNKSNCGSCHGTGTIIGGPGVIQVTLFGADDKGSWVGLEHLGGPLFQLNSISSECREDIPPEATIVVNRVTLGAMAYGLVEAIPDAELFALEDPFDTDSDDISGRVHVVEALEAPGVSRAGRFGWKAQIATVLSFSADASVGEMGFTNRLIPEETAPNGDELLLAECDTVADPEDGPDANGLDFIDRVTFFQRYLAPPPQTPRSGMEGATVFNDIGCAKCHTTTFTTPDDPALEEVLRDRTFHPYSDFLLHSMGLLTDGVRQGNAFESEMRTPPLWGLRWRDPMLHDGRAAGGSFITRTTDAIQQHGPFGEGADSAAAFAALSEDDKAALFRFLDSLGRNEFDFDGDEDVDLDDFNTFKDCFVLDNVISPEESCAIGDVDQDGDVDLVDAGYFLEVFEGELVDCNDNGVIDLLDILNGTSADADGNGELDECFCLGDINGDGEVDGVDLSSLLGNWNTTAPAADLNQNGLVEGGDLAVLLGEWGNCDS
ncbi:MAG: di-heme oxidoredictase family protein [Phycisphaerales bacterium]|nr:di-heme oxidoredictase family protein [Phycisphaerales bacterium]